MNLLMLMLMMMILMYLLFMFYTTPLMMSLMLIFFILCSVVLIGMNFKSFYYSFIIFMVMVGGLMIIFMYFSSLSDFEKVIVKIEIYIMLLIVCIFFILSFKKQFNIMYDFIFYCYKDLNMNFDKMSLDLNYILESYNYVGLILMIMSILYLILMLICIIKICLNHKFSLRKMTKF